MKRKNPIFLFSKTPHPDVTHIPVLETHFLQPYIDYSRYDAIVVTSKQAVTALEKISAEWRALPVLTVAAKTAETVRKANGRLLETGDGYGDSLSEIIIHKYGSYRWLYPRPNVVASDFKERVAKAGVKIDDVVVYETLCNKECQKLKLPDDAVLVFTSPLTIVCFLQFFTLKASHKVVVIGKTTAKALPRHLKYRMPEEPSVEASVQLAQTL